MSNVRSESIVPKGYFVNRASLPILKESDSILPSMTYLVTGGAGFIGSHMVDHLLKEGHTVIVVDNLSSGHRENLAHHGNNPRLVTYRRNVCDGLEDIFEHFTPISGIVHFAGVPGVQLSIQNPETTHHFNLNGTLNLLESARRFKVNRVVYSSSAAVYGDQEVMPLREDVHPHPLSPYALHKLTGEEYCRLYQQLYGLETVALRYMNVFGSRQDPAGPYASAIPRFMNLLLRGVPPRINGDGEQTRDFIHVDDVVRAVMRALLVEDKATFGQPFNIGSGKSISINEVVRHIGQIAGQEVQPEYTAPVVEIRHSRADISKARQLLGWEPLKDFSEGLQETYRHMKKSEEIVHQEDPYALGVHLR